MLSSADTLKGFEIPPGYRLALVLSEPQLREPVLTVFDGNGRMFVAEMRSSLQDINATDAKAPVSRSSMHGSSKGDGVDDRHSVFLDHLLLPRMILPLRDSILVQETDSGDSFEYRDTDGDGVSDPKKLTLTVESGRTDGAWIQLKSPTPKTLSEIRLSSSKSPHNYARAVNIELSENGLAWGAPVATGKGNSPLLELAFACTPAKFVRITQSDLAKTQTWTLDDIVLFSPAARSAPAAL